MEVKLPLGKGFVVAELPEDTVVVESSIPRGVPASEVGGLVDSALDNPIGSPRHEELAHGAERVAVLVTDKTRATPVKLLLPYVLQRLGRAGVPRDRIVVVVATGLHRPHGYEELREVVGNYYVSLFALF